MEHEVLFVGGHENTVGRLRSELRKEPYGVAHVEDEHRAHEYMGNTSIDVVVAFEELSGPGGCPEFLSEVRERAPGVVRLMVIGEGERATMKDAVNKAEIYRFLSLPLVPAEVAQILRNALTIVRISKAQEIVWAAASQQKEAMHALTSSHSLNIPDSRIVISATRFASHPNDARPRSQELHSLPQETNQRLSKREGEIVQAVAGGKRVKAIAVELVISPHTVRNHLKTIYRKLGVGSQFELVALMARAR